MSDVQPVKLTRKELFITVYAAIAIIFTFWNWLFSAENERGFFFNFGRALVWPFQVFPIFGQIFGAIFIVVLIIAVLAFGSAKDA